VLMVIENGQSANDFPLFSTPVMMIAAMKIAEITHASSSSPQPSARKRSSEAEKPDCCCRRSAMRGSTGVVVVPQWVLSLLARLIFPLGN
jgi:hypothetical protein